jgi:hypothetical protein
VAGFGRKRAINSPSTINRPASLSSAGMLKFDVTPSPAKMLMGIVFSGGGALFFFDKLVDPRGLIISGMIELGPTGADVFYGVLIGGCLIFCLLAGYGLLNAFGERVFVTLDNISIAGPTRYNGTQVIRITYPMIGKVDLTRVNDQESVVITGKDGGKIRVSQTNFRNTSQWPQFLEELGRHTR